MNVTDIDDKIIKGAAAAGTTIQELTGRWLAAFRADAEQLRMTVPEVQPRATEHIDDIVELIAILLQSGHAYRTDDGSIFFRIASWPAYGRLARLDPEQMRVGERVESDEYAKDDVRDFALWKGQKPGEPSWETSIGAGRPGWHIECSAMSMKHLGRSFDIHTGGVDLIFPHHEDEIAQSEAATGRPFVRTWLHCAHLQSSGSKMAKSAGNIARFSDLLEAGVSARALRYALIAVHYRAPLNYSDESLTAAAAALDRLDAAVAALRAYGESGPGDPDLDAALAAADDAFGTALDDDLNISAALAVVFDLVRDLNRRIDGRTLSTDDAERALGMLRSFDEVLGVLPAADEDLDEDSRRMLDDRATARRNRDWAASDRLRVPVQQLQQPDDVRARPLAGLVRLAEPDRPSCREPPEQSRQVVDLHQLGWAAADIKKWEQVVAAGLKK